MIMQVQYWFINHITFNAIRDLTRLIYAFKFNYIISSINCLKIQKCLIIHKTAKNSNPSSRCTS